MPPESARCRVALTPLTSQKNETFRMQPRLLPASNAMKEMPSSAEFIVQVPDNNPAFSDLQTVDENFQKKEALIKYDRKVYVPPDVKGLFVAYLPLVGGHSGSHKLLALFESKYSESPVGASLWDLGF